MLKSGGVHLCSKTGKIAKGMVEMKLTFLKIFGQINRSIMLFQGLFETMKMDQNCCQIQRWLTPDLCWSILAIVALLAIFCLLKCCRLACLSVAWNIPALLFPSRNNASAVPRGKQKGLDGISANIASFRWPHRKYHARHVIKRLLANKETKSGC